MIGRAFGRTALAAAMALCGCGPMLAVSTQPAEAQDFFSALFGGFGGRHRQAAPLVMPFGSEGPWQGERPRYDARPRYGGGQAYCVRTCDGRYFPISGPDNASRVSSCNSFCPASKTEVVYGGNIDEAATDRGKAYSELPNAFRYRNELVAGCTCNGKDQVGLAQVGVENDPTLRKGDVVAGPNGLVVANTSAGSRSASLNFSPASERIRAKYQRVPVVARE